MKKFLIIVIFISINILANDGYKVYEKIDVYGDSITYADVNGIDDDIELLIGVGMPEVLSLDATKNKNIKLLRCFGGHIGTSTLVGYYYTYILDFKNKKSLGVIEFSQEDDYKEEKPIWKFKKNKIEVKYHDWYSDSTYKTAIYEIQ